ncbi:uncharacterized protein LOC101864560 [Aplysia californica]|uniref:Integral membrane protein 2 n=1 Tax=Aplysia californica TaxID=6500 RepID=A0ABM0K5M6_APLCA|nr:uncharacterized protein LOC101864560 [Aplysia californica]
MTIYTPGQADKESKNTADPEVVTEPLTSFKEDDYEADLAPKLVRVTYFPRNRRTFYIHLLLTVMVMVILTCGAIGAVVFYRHLNKKVYTGMCGTRFYDPEYHELRGDVVDAELLQDQAPQSPHSPQPQAMYKAHYVMDFMEEGIEVSRVEQYEEMHTPSFDEVRENTVWHDFVSNYTAIMDRRLERCYIMRLDRANIAPPSDILDLLEKLMSGYYMKSAVVVRDNYRLVKPALEDLAPFGNRIRAKCGSYESFWMEKFVGGVSKRSAEYGAPDEKTLVYAVLGNYIEHPQIFKIIVHGVDDAGEENAV